MPYVVVQQAGAADSVDEWRPPPSHVPEAEQELKWEEVCGKLVSLAGGKYKTSSFNVFLQFGRLELLKKRDAPALGRLIAHARERCWGARLLLALSKAPSIAQILAADRAGSADIKAWMKEVLAGRVSDIVQIDSSESTTPDELRDILRNHASAVTQRHELLLGTSGRRPWRCALPPNWLDTANFLGAELATTRADGQGGHDLVILVQGSTREEQEGELDRHLAKDPTRRRRYRVVTYEHDPEHLQTLQDLCQEREIVQPVVMEGDFELWYLMLRLHEQARTKWDEAESIHPVPLAPSPKFTISDHERLPAILLTSTFDASEKSQWLEAATDVGTFLHLSPLGIDYRVELVIDTQRLIQVVNEMGIVDAWIHMGHGSGIEGIWAPGKPTRREDWADCFGKKELRLAMFLTCESHEIARYFAAQGAGVAIGFDGKVESKKTRQLAKGVLEAMLTEGARGGRILAGFLSGEAWFRATQSLTATPRAYYPKRA